MAAGEPFEAEFRLRRADGAYRWFLGRGVPLRDGEGRVSRWLGVATDIDDQRRARDRQAFLTEASATLASSLEFETTLATVSRLVVPRLGDWCVVHLLQENGTLRHVGLYHRDPARVRLVEEMLALHPLDPDLPYGYPKVLRTGESQLLPQITGEMVRAAARQMDALTRDLLALARIGRTSLEVRPIDPASILREVLEGMQEEITARGAQVALEEPFPSVRGDRLLLGQALQNYLSNGVKFVAPGVPPRVRVRAERRDGRVRLWVEDNGIGILREYWDRVFRLFERLHTAQEYPGTGVGLATVQTAADRMGGRVGVESEPGKGSRFWIELPAG
jgi:signal transduction histidine kinase